MFKLPALKAKRILKILLKLNFYIHHQVGSHIQLRHHEKKYLRVTIPRHDNFDLPVFVVHSILKQAEINKEEFWNLLK